MFNIKQFIHREIFKYHLYLLNKRIANDEDGRASYLACKSMVERMDLSRNYMSFSGYDISVSVEDVTVLLSLLREAKDSYLHTGNVNYNARRVAPVVDLANAATWLLKPLYRRQISLRRAMALLHVYLDSLYLDEEKDTITKNYINRKTKRLLYNYTSLVVLICTVYIEEKRTF